MKLITPVVFSATMMVSLAQSQTKGALPKFEVASVKVSADRASPETFDIKSNRLTATSAPLSLLIQLAFGVRPNQLAGSPNWFSEERYDITARMPGEENLTQQTFKVPLQLLLAERFKLVTHRETTDVQGYALVVAKGGPKLQKGTGPPVGTAIRRGGLSGHNASMRNLAAMLERPVGRPVEDKTGIGGTYEFELKYAEGTEPSAESSLPSVFTVLQEQLGLKLEPQKVAVEMLVIDHVERVPTEN